MSAFWTVVEWVAFYIAIPGAAAVGAYAFIRGVMESLPARWLDAAAERLNDAYAIAIEWLTLPLRLVLRPKGQHCDKFATTPAPDAAQGQAPVPGTASPAPGTTLAPAPWPAPEVALSPSAAVLPEPPNPPSTEAGQHPRWVILPDDHAVAYLGKHVRIQPLANPGKCETTGAQPALVRPARRMYEEWLDQPARTA